MPVLIAPGAPGFLMLCLGAAFVLVNLASHAAFRADKRRAVRGEWRIPERTLLLLALLGGWPGAKLAQRQFRHKTRKQPFASLLNAVPLVWALGIGAAVWVAPMDVAERAAAVGQDVARAVGTFGGVLAQDGRALPRRFGPGGVGAGVEGAQAEGGQTQGASGGRAMPHRFGPGSEGG